MFGHAPLEALLRRDAGDQAGLRIGQEIRRRLAVQHDRLADFIQAGVGADGGKLRRAVAPRLHAERLVVVPEESVICHGRYCTFRTCGCGRQALR